MIMDSFLRALRRFIAKRIIFSLEEKKKNKDEDKQKNITKNSIDNKEENIEKRPIVDYNSINVNNIDETIDFIIKNNVIYNEEEMKEKLNNIKFKGYMKDLFNNRINELYNKQIIFNLKSIAYENTTMAPGAVISKFGYLVIRTTCGGNAICINLNSSTTNPEVYFADHSIFCDKESKFKVDGKNTYCELTEDILKQNINIIYDSLENFINDVIDNKIDVDDYDLEF